MDYPDKIIITGFSGGLGQALVRELPLDKVIGITRTVIPDIQCTQFFHDLRKYNFLPYYLLEYLSTFKDEKIALVLAAGTLGIPGGIVNCDLLEWEKTIRVNLLGNLSIIKAIIPNILRTGYGRIVFLSGGGASNPRPLFSAYSISKTAIVREVENIAEEFKSLVDFSIIALAPGAMETNMLKEARFYGEEIKNTIDIKEPVEFIKNFIFMDSEKAKKLSGKFIHVRDDLESIDFSNKWLLRRIEK